MKVGRRSFLGALLASGAAMMAPIPARAARAANRYRVGDLVVLDDGRCVGVMGPEGRVIRHGPVYIRADAFRRHESRLAG